MPVASSVGRKCPAHAGPGEAGLNVDVLGNVIGIIAIEEFVADSPAEEEQRAQKKNQTDDVRMGGGTFNRRLFHCVVG